MNKDSFFNFFSRQPKLPAPSPVFDVSAAATTTYESAAVPLFCAYSNKLTTEALFSPGGKFVTKYIALLITCYQFAIHGGMFAGSLQSSHVPAKIEKSPQSTEPPEQELLSKSAGLPQSVASHWPAKTEKSPQLT